MKLKHIIVFLLVFSIEIKIKASGNSIHSEGANQGSFVDEPEHCLEKSSFCTVRSLKKYAIQEDDFRISMKTDTVLMRHDLLTWSFVSGDIFVKTKQKIILKTIYGEIIVTPKTQCLIKKNDNSYSVQVLFGKVFFKGIGHKQEYAVLEGFENIMSEVNDSMKSEIGIPKPVLFDIALAEWNYHFAGTKKQFTEDVERFKPIHESAKKELSELNQQIVQRELASHSDSKRKKKAALGLQKNLKSTNQNRTIDRILGE